MGADPIEPTRQDRDQGFESLAAELRLMHRDTSGFLDLLAQRFERALPGCTTVRRRWGIFGGRVVGLELHLGDLLYRFDASNPPFYAVTRQRVAGGIAIGTADKLEGDTWPVKLCEDLSKFTHGERLSAQALERILLGRQ